MRLFEDNAGWACGVAKRIANRRRPRGVLLFEMRDAALEGLQVAAQRFEVDRAITFRAFAFPRVRGGVMDLLRARSARGSRQPADGLLDLVPDPRGGEAFEQVERQELLARLWPALPSGLHRAVLYLHVARSWTYRRIGRVYGFSGARAQQIMREAVESARAEAARMGLVVGRNDAEHHA